MHLHKRLHSFKYAFKGIKIGWREEANFRFDIVCATLAIVAAWLLRLSLLEWIVVVFSIGLVLSAELFNTALEELCDMMRPTHDPHVAKIKDLAAGATLVASWTALIAGAVVFVPHLLRFLN